MLAELTIVPLNVGDHLSGPLAEVLDLVDRSGVRYKLTPTGTCLEGSWDEVLDVVRACHAHVRQKSRHVFTTIRIEDEEGADDKLVSNITSIEEKLNRPVAKAGGTVR